MRRETTIRFDDPQAELNLGGIGKGYALDRAGEFLSESGLTDWLMHGGFSSLLARGNINTKAAGPWEFGTPCFPTRPWARFCSKTGPCPPAAPACNRFASGGKKYGHILDPRTGWPVEGLLSVTVLAPTAAEADALSTAFFVLGLEKAHEYCDNNPNVSSLLIPPPHRGRSLAPVNCGIPDDVLFLETTTPPTSK